jgi:CubicO group peptidase (beta-lactamase class C family)
MKKFTGKRGLLFWGIAAICVAAVAIGACVGVDRLAEPKSDDKAGRFPEYPDPFRSASPEEMGFSSRSLAQGIERLRGEGATIHSLMLIRNGAVFLDARFDPYDGETYHKLASVTKSFTATLVGIAIDEGLIGLDDPILKFFPDRRVADEDGRKAKIRLRHLLTLTSGFAGSSAGNEAETMAARATADWVQYALDRKMAAEPGANFVYSNLDMHLLSAIIGKATGRSALDYAREKLFGPLGVTDVFWDVDPQGNNRGWGDLCLKPADMAKVGLLYLCGGMWQGRKILSEGWVREATGRLVRTPRRFAEDYGYGIWISKENEPFDFYIFSGDGGQMIRVIPELEALIVTTGGAFESARAMEVVAAAFAGPGKTLERDPAGEEALRAAVAAWAGPPSSAGVVPLPPRAREISGITYGFRENLMDIASVRFDFPGASEASLEYRLGSEGAARHALIGLDGRDRIDVSGMPTYARGSWTGPDRFDLVLSEGPGMNVYRLVFDFEAGAVTLTFSDLGSGGSVAIRGEAR